MSAKTAAQSMKRPIYRGTRFIGDGAATDKFLNNGVPNSPTDNLTAHIRFMGKITAQPDDDHSTNGQIIDGHEPGHDQDRAATGSGLRQEPTNNYKVERPCDLLKPPFGKSSARRYRLSESYIKTSPPPRQNFLATWCSQFDNLYDSDETPEDSSPDLDSSQYPRPVCSTSANEQNTGQNQDDDGALSPDSEQSLYNLSKYQLRHFLRTTTFHGLDQVFVSRAMFTRFFWAIMMLFVFVIVVYQLRELLNQFINNPTLTSIDVVYPKQGVKVPRVTLCMLSKLNQTKVEEKYPNVSTSLAELSMSSFLSAYSTALMDIYYFQRTTNQTNQQLEDQLYEATGHINTTDFIYDTTFTCENQFLICWFENGHMFDCCRPNAYVHVRRLLTHSGACFEFSNDHNPQRLPGPVGGFGFVYWYPNEHIYRTAYNSYNEHAVHLYMSPVDAMLENNPISLPVGYHSHINLQATKTERLMADQMGRTMCKLKQLKYFRNYTYQACQVECLIDMMLNKCNCTGVADYADIPQDYICSPMKALQCYEMLAYDFSDLLVTCRQERCEEACDYWTYRASLTVSRVFNPLIEDKMLKYWRLPEGDPSQSLIIGDVFFGEIQYTKVTQMPALTIEGFISSIGGAMGLWTGASIITWIHLLYFCCATCFFKRSPVRYAAERTYRSARVRSGRRRITKVNTDWTVDVDALRTHD